MKTGRGVGFTWNGDAMGYAWNRDWTSRGMKAVDEILTVEHDRFKSHRHLNTTVSL